MSRFSLLNGIKKNNKHSILIRVLFLCEDRSGFFFSSYWVRLHHAPPWQLNHLTVTGPCWMIVLWEKKVQSLLINVPSWQIYQREMHRNDLPQMEIAPDSSQPCQISLTDNFKVNVTNPEHFFHWEILWRCLQTAFDTWDLSCHKASKLILSLSRDYTSSQHLGKINGK